jgi:hypothetical protein
VPSRSLASLLALATLCGGSAPAPDVTERDPDLVAGIHLVKEGDFENAVLKLDAAVRGLDAAARTADAAQAYLYLGVAYLELDQEALARGKFAQALARQPQMNLDPGEFSPQVIRTFEATRNEALPPESNGRASASGAAASGAELRKKGRSATPYLILGGAAAAAGGVALATNGNPRSSPTPSPSASPTPAPTPTPPAVPCTFVISRGNQEFPAAGGVGFCDVDTQPACTWKAVAADPWLTVFPPLVTRTGADRIDFRVNPNNSGVKRDGEIQVRHNGARVAACLIRQEADTASVRAPASWTSELAVPGGSGRLALDGAFVSLQGQGGAPGGRVLTRGTHRFEAVLTAGGGPGVWRFRLREGFRAGTLRVLAGEAAAVGAAEVVFRLRGRAGERVVFTVDAGR